MEAAAEATLRVEAATPELIEAATKALVETAAKLTAALIKATAATEALVETAGFEVSRHPTAEWA